MKSETSFVVIGLVIATTALGFATVGPLPAASNMSEAPPVHFADSSGAGTAPRVYCYNGIKDPSASRGWVCVPQDKRSLTN